MEDFWIPHRIYFDTEPLRAAGWPLVSNDTKLFMSSLERSNYKCIVPDPVLRELRQHWIKSTNSDASTLGQLATRLAHFGVSQLPRLDVASLDPQYQAHVDGFLKDTGASRCPISTRPLHELFEYAAVRSLTFTDANSDRGFKDAVVLLSVIDDLPVGTPAALITRDKAFSSEGSLGVIAQSARDLRILGTIEDLRGVLGRASETLDRLKNENQRLKVALWIDKNRSVLEAFMAAELFALPYALEPASHRLVAINAIRLRSPDAEAVQVGEPTVASGKIPLSAQVEADVDVVVEVPQYPRIRFLKVGEPLESLSAEEIAGALVPQRIESTRTGLIDLDLEAESSDTEFGNLTPTRAYLNKIMPPRLPPEFSNTDSSKTD